MKLVAALLLLLIAFALAFWLRIARTRQRSGGARLPEVVVLLSDVEARTALLTVMNRGAAPVTVGPLDVAVFRDEALVREVRCPGGPAVAPGRTEEIRVELPVGPLDPGEYRYAFRYGTSNLGTHAVIVE
jgi:hypothetical protein